MASVLSAHPASARPQRPVDAAAALGISEAEWLLTNSPAHVRQLGVDVHSIFGRLTALGPVMALTRNRSCVHEKDGVYDAIDLGKAMGVVLNHDIDLRLFLNRWVHALSVDTPLDDGGVRRSIQFFDAAGVAVHKIFSRPATDMAAWEALVADFIDDDADGTPHFLPYPAKAADRPDHDIDIDDLRRRWDAMKDVHDFFAMLKKVGVGRLQAMRLAGAPYARPLPVDVVLPMLEAAARDAVPIMCFVGNEGCIQIHSGPVSRIQPMGPWINVLDPGFNLHLRGDHVAHAYAVWKPQSDSAVNSIELFDAEGMLIAQFFGERKPGIPERADWQQLVQNLVPA